MYRYMKSEHLDSFMKYGKIRVGTLHDFRKDEHKKGIADKDEGRKDISHHFDNYRHIGAAPVAAGNLDDAWFSRPFSGFGVAPEQSLTLSNVTVTKRFESENCYILCSSSVASIETMAEFEGADSCIEIVDKVGFLHCLSWALCSVFKSDVVLEGNFPVNYQDRSEIWNGENSDIPPALIKSLSYVNQHESRAIWTRRDVSDIEPIILSDFRLPGFCRVVKF